MADARENLRQLIAAGERAGDPVARALANELQRLIDKHPGLAAAQPPGRVDALLDRVDNELAVVDVPLKAAASLTGVSIESVRRWAERREIVAAKIGSRWYTSLASVRVRAARLGQHR